MPIKRPVIGDADYLEITMLTRTSRNKTRVAVNSTFWYGSERISITVRNLTEVAKNNFVNAMQANAGKLMYYIAPLITALLFIIIGLFAFAKKPKASANRCFLFLCVSTFVWQFSWAILFCFGWRRTMYTR